MPAQRGRGFCVGKVCVGGVCVGLVRERVIAVLVCVGGRGVSIAVLPLTGRRLPPFDIGYPLPYCYLSEGNNALTSTGRFPTTTRKVPNVSHNR